MNSLNSYIDHTNLKPDADRNSISQLCSEAVRYGFYSVCVNSSRVSEAAEHLHGSEVKVCAVCGFPLGACTTACKVAEASEACILGASETDMVINIGMLKDGNYDYVKEDISAVASAVHSHGGILKVILETCLLSDEEKIKAAELAIEAGCDFLKTSTGFSSGGATVSDVRLLRNVSDRMTDGRVKVKAAGGIRTAETAAEMIKAGADRIGASSSVSMIEEQQKDI